MIISDINYLEVVSEQEISVEGGNTASYSSIIAKEIRANISQGAVSSSVAVGGISNVAVIGSYVGSVTANTNATSSATNNLNFNFSA
jgi:hypothetical protein